MFFQSYLPGNYWGGQILRTHLKRLDSLIQEEFQMAIAQILKVTTEVKDGTRSYRPVTNITLNARPLRCRQNQHSYAADVE